LKRKSLKMNKQKKKTQNNKERKERKGQKKEEGNLGRVAHVGVEEEDGTEVVCGAGNLQRLLQHLLQHKRRSKLVLFIIVVS
jgi:hypothetical protein